MHKCLICGQDSIGKAKYYVRQGRIQKLAVSGETCRGCYDLMCNLLKQGLDFTDKCIQEAKAEFKKARAAMPL
jgi:hypothetical protein